MFLIAVDDLLFSSKIRAAAKHAGAEIVFARTPAEILQQARALRPSAVILDLNSERVDPIGTIRVLKADAELAGRFHPRILVMTTVRTRDRDIARDLAQESMIAALGDDEHVQAQKALYRARRDRLRPAIEGAGFRIDNSEAGLYLWATEGRDAWESMGRLAELGILAGPGVFYGDAYPQHVRFSLTATDERIEQAARRLEASTAR